MSKDENQKVVALSANGVEVSLQLYQDVYASVTGKKESTSKTFYEAHHIRLNDIHNLHNQIAQLVEQYACESSNCSIVVRYSDSRSERFSSFEKFIRLAGTRSSCVEHIELEYDFLFVLPKTKEAKSYKIEFLLVSQVGLQDRLSRTSASAIELRVMEDFVNFSGNLKIEYVDVAVARNLEHQIDEWYRGIPKAEQSYIHKLAKFFTKHADNITKGSGYLAIALAAWFIISPSVVSFETTFKAVILVMLSTATVTMLGYDLGRWAGNIFRKIRPRSFIELSQIDLDTKQQLEKSRLAAFGTLLLATIFTVSIGLATTYIGKLIGL